MTRKYNTKHKILLIIAITVILCVQFAQTAPKSKKQTQSTQQESVKQIPACDDAKSCLELELKQRERETIIYLKVVQEIAYNVWAGFLEGFYDRDPHLKRQKCMGDTQLTLMQATMEIAESFTKDTLFFSAAKLIRNLLHIIAGVRSQCKVDSFLQDIMGFCEDHCEGKKIIQRLSQNFNKLSRVYKDIMKLLYDSDPESLIEELKIAAEIGGKLGELLRMAVGFSDVDVDMLDL
eukprot:403341800